MPNKRTPKTASALLAQAQAKQAAARARASNARSHSSKCTPASAVDVPPPPLPRGIASLGNRIADAIAATVASAFPTINPGDLRCEARASFGLWLAVGPRRHDGTPRFRRWRMHAAALTLWKRTRAEAKTRGNRKMILENLPASLLRSIREQCEGYARKRAKRTLSVLPLPTPFTFTVPAKIVQPVGLLTT